MSSPKTDQLFGLSSILTRRIDFTFNRSPDLEKLKQAFRIECKIIDDSKIGVLFGFYLAGEDLQPNTPSVLAVVELTTTVTLNSAVGTPKKLGEVPLIGNILAIMYPFLREKVNYCFSANGVNILLPPINTLNLIKENESNSAFCIVDLRTQAKDSAPAINDENS